MVLFCINLDGSFVESSGFVTWSLPTKVCGTIGYEVTFFIFKSIYNLTQKKKKSIYKLRKLKVFWSFRFGTSFEKMGWKYYVTYSLEIPMS